MINKINEFKDFFKLVMSEKIDTKLLELVYKKDDQQVLRFSDDLWIYQDIQPTFITNEKNICLYMHINQAENYLNDHSLRKIKNFERNFNSYLKIYNKIQNNYKINYVDMYLSIEYDMLSKCYITNLSHKKYIFCPYEESHSSHFSYKSVMMNLMRVDPNEYIQSDYQNTKSKLLLKENPNNFPNIQLLPEQINIIDSNVPEKFENMFTIIDGLYQSSELFTVIQSYLNITDNDNCNILNPNLIEDKNHLDRLIELKYMIDIL